MAIDAKLVKELRDETGLPACDPVRDGAGPLLDSLNLEEDTS